MIDEFRKILGIDAVLTADMDAYVTDWRGNRGGPPAAVLRPRDTRQVSEVLRLAHQRGIGIVPQGGNTGLAAGAIPDRSGTQVVLSLSRMNAIRDVDPVGSTLTAEAGCVLKTAQDAADMHARVLPISIAAEGSAQIGGIVSTNAGGLNVLRYGMTRQSVLGLEVVMANGTVLDGLRRLRKDNAGYDWKQLFIGSEGTLGIVTAAVLRLVPRPKHVVTSMLAVPSPRAALDLLTLVQEELGDTITAFEMMSGLSLQLVETHFGLKAPVTGNGWFVLIEASSSLHGLRDAVESALAQALDRTFVTDAVIAESQAQAGQLWAIRERMAEAELREGFGAKHDISVPIPALPGFLVEAETAVLSRFGAARIDAFGHAGDGNIHFNVLDVRREDAADVNRIVHDLVIAHGGSISAEHGIGSYRVDELARCKSGSEMDLIRLMKSTIDPRRILNPGKVVRQ